ncbi:hypothetical protein ASG40_14735 [Methylobacterium sp. Leaf399]|uniref:alginate O-acetyltransferase AlgX-related protein n=1 Tax=unclassified Methylobacterium TaxID=2615210 RepID=UPI0006FE8A0C|nr:MULTISPECIES: hypothetical protein [unclassified Methylobacterium]KQP50247.1 hypothetical protein ASF39_13080 [Methylobacterium sp. Leaf108]KQT07248.1 hypothetical protein ASG40_14735 [Methylobacterium sp. Leaf399]KQT76911.1 hypothetical protein ASG59_13200 [Methylobacterium sp. Leaf466]
MQRHKREIVHVGREGWLFLIGGTNGVLDQYRSTWRWWQLLRGWAKLIRQRSARARSLGIRYAHIVVPEKLSVYDDRTDGLVFDPGKSPARRLARRLAGEAALVDLLGPMRAARDGPVPLYYRTDSHWSHDGCLLAYRHLMRACGAVVPPDIADRPRFDTERVRDLGEKLPDRPVERASLCCIARDAARSYASPLVESYEAADRAPYLHGGAHVVYRNENPAADPRTLMLFGDSYAHFAPIMLTGLLAESFREVHFIWSSSLDWRHIEQVRPDLLVTEMAERFMVRLPDDAYDLLDRSGPEDPAHLDSLPPFPASEIV